MKMMTPENGYDRDQRLNVESRFRVTRGDDRSRIKIIRPDLAHFAITEQEEFAQMGRREVWIGKFERQYGDGIIAAAGGLYAVEA